MRFLSKSTLPFTTGLALTLMAAAPAAAQEVNIYRFEAQENHCPAGLRPVAVAGVSSCGTANQAQTYQQAMRHPAPRHVRHARSYSARPNCSEGSKGCS